MRFLTCAQRVSTLLIAFVHAMVDSLLMSHRYSFQAHDLSSSLTMFVLDSFLDLKYNCRIILSRRFSSSLNKVDVSVVIVEIWCTRPRLQSTRLECFRFGLSDSKTTEFVLIFSLASHEFNNFLSSYRSGCSTRLVVCAYDRHLSKSILLQSHVTLSLLSRSSYTRMTPRRTSPRLHASSRAMCESHQYFSTASCR